MAEIVSHPPHQKLSIEHVLLEAQDRWFRPPEICGILRNHQNYYVTPEPPARPPAGSLFLFNRKVLRYFRKDGYNWRKKNDGKTIREAHEKLKVDGVDALQCYYAHGEDNAKFQRRIYWMLDRELEHIVLVHYRDLTEKIGHSPLLTAIDSVTNSASLSEQSPSPVPASYTYKAGVLDWNELRVSSTRGDMDSGYTGVVSTIPGIQQSIPNDTVLPDKAKGFFEFPKDNHISQFNDGIYIPATSSLGNYIHGSRRDPNATHNQKPQLDQLNRTNLLSQKLTDTRLDVDEVFQKLSNARRGLFPDTQGMVQVHGASCPPTDCSDQVAIPVGEVGELKKSDSFGRWMDKEIDADCDDSLMASRSADYRRTFSSANNDKEAPSLSLRMQLDADELSPAPSQEQLFSVFEFAPDWAYSGVETKVLIVGAFLGEKKVSDDCNLRFMFGDVEVSVELVSDNVIRCQVPFHAPGRVSFYLTCGNSLARSEVQEFEFRVKPLRMMSPLLAKTAPDEMSLEIRFAKMLCLGLDKKWLDCIAVDCDKYKVKQKICTLQDAMVKVEEKFEDGLIESNYRTFKNVMIQHLLKDKLYKWLICKAHEEGKGPNVLDDKGQGIIHLAASLGYVWALGPIVAAGCSPNFRDKQGRTSLHWASYFGREEDVVSLIKLGASAGAVDDPTPEFPGGRTAADLASDRGHKGLAAYLAEADLSSHLLSLSFIEGRKGSTNTTIGAETALRTDPKNIAPAKGTVDEDYSLRVSLCAIRRSAHAASIIQAAFREHSFHQRPLTRGWDDDSEVNLDLVTLGSLNKIQRLEGYDGYLHSAAIKIQHKYRGWKGRKDFLRIRACVLKLQGHQVRKHYKKVLWSVSVVDKAILRWRRRKPGLRGFRTANTVGSIHTKISQNDEYEYLRISRRLKAAGVENALAWVQSMVRCPEARDQYTRLLMKFENVKLDYDESS